MRRRIEGDCVAVLPTELELMGRIALAAACGAAIGLEREFVEKPAGLRTHALVALGAAAFTVSGYSALASSSSPIDITRIPAQVVNGIGFLGGALVIFHGDRLRGLTTAAEMWTVAAIGVLCGLGQVDLALAGSAMTLFILVGGRPIETVIDRLRRRRHRRERERLAALGVVDEDGPNGDDGDDINLLD